MEGREGNKRRQTNAHKGRRTRAGGRAGGSRRKAEKRRRKNLANRR